MERRDVSFTAADGLVLRGWLYPAVTSPSPCIIMTHGLGGVRQWRLPHFAERFQRGGYSVLLYDNRHWGESDGFPRQHSNPFSQYTDYYDAFNYACTLPFVDKSRIVYWQVFLATNQPVTFAKYNKLLSRGTSFSGGNVIYAAAIDRRIKAAIIQCSSVSGQVRAEAFKERISSLLDERTLTAKGGQEPRIPLIASCREAAVQANEPVMFPDLQAYNDLAGMETLENWTNHVTAQTQVHMALSEPQAVIHRISPTPLLMVVPEKDITVKTSSQLAAFEKAQEPKELVMIQNAGHFDIYSGEAFEENISAQLRFLDRVLQ